MDRKASSTTANSPENIFPSSLPQLNEKVIKSVPALIVVYNINTGQYIYVNDAVEKLLGFKTSDFIKKGLPFVASLVHPEDIGRIMEENNQALKIANDKKYVDKANTVITTFEYRMRHKNGNYRWLHSDGVVFDRDSKGKVKHVMNISVDITERKKQEFKAVEERKRAEKKAQQGEERYKTFLTNSSEAIWRFELEKPVKISIPPAKQIKLWYKYAYLAECNDALANMYGYSNAGEIIGVRLGDMLPQHDKNNIDYLNSFIKSGYNLSNAESHEIDKKGNSKYFSNNLVGIIEKGYLKRAWGTQRDITGGKKSQNDLKEALKKLSDMKYALDQSSIVAITDKNGVIQYVNDKFIEISEYNRNELIGKTHRVINSKSHPKEFMKNLWDTILSGKVWHGEIKNKTKSGRYYWVDTTITPLLDEKGKPNQFIAIRNDITERKNLEKQKDDFIGVASHELKTPVTSIKSYTQVLHRRFLKQGDEQSASLLLKMDAQINKLTNLISDLLDVTKIETGKLLIREESFEFDELVKELIEELQRTTDKHKIIKDGKTNKTIYGDRDRIGQVLTNLLSNAIKYSPHAKKIIVKLAKNKDTITCCIQDFGVGIPEKKQKNIFERFYRVSGPKEDTYPGLGLGLYISSQIVKRHGGKIWVESKKNKGSLFCFSLPIQEKT